MIKFYINLGPSPKIQKYSGATSPKNSMRECMRVNWSEQVGIVVIGGFIILTQTWIGINLVLIMFSYLVTKLLLDRRRRYLHHEIHH